MKPKHRKPRGRADFARAVARVKESGTGAGLKVALAKAAVGCPDKGVAALLRAMAEKGTDRGVRELEGDRGESAGRER